jgi:hypothetical protein
VMYGLTLGPLLWWHAAPPRSFAWFMQGDFVLSLPPALGSAAAWLGAALFVVYLGWQAWLWRSDCVVPGKALLAVTTALCWYGGIVVFDSDYVFTATNVLIHGVPYLLLTQRYARGLARRGLASRIAHAGLPPLMLTCCAFAWGEESLWDLWVWHEHPDLFGESPALPPSTLVWLVPLLAVPQLTHYLLDGFVWRVRNENPVLRREFETRSR